MLTRAKRKSLFVLFAFFSITKVDDSSKEVSLPQILLIFLTLICLLLYISGNVFVIAAILLERNLHCVANYLILSLAVADLFVAVLVMPLGAVYEVLNIFTVLFKMVLASTVE